MGFDWSTFVFEVVNFLVLLVLLERIVYRPLQRGIDARRQAIAAREQAAARTAEEAEVMRAGLEQRTRALDQLRQQTLREAAEQAAEERARMLAQAREDAAAERARVQRMLEAEREAAEGWVRALAIERSTALAGQMLLQLAPDPLDQALWAQLCQAAARLPEAQADITVEVTAARAPGDEALARLRERLESTSGARTRLQVRTDASLLAGAVLRAGHRVLDASLQGQLDAVRERALADTEGADQKGPQREAPAEVGAHG